MSMMKAWQERAVACRKWSNSSAWSGNILLVMALINVWNNEFQIGFFCFFAGCFNFWISGKFEEQAKKA